MSLSLAIDQITRPSFYGQQKGKVKTSTEKRAAESEDRRAKLAQIIRSAGKPVPYEYLVEKTGWKLQSIRNLIAPMARGGNVRRIDTGSANVLVEWVR